MLKPSNKANREGGKTPKHPQNCTLSHWSRSYPRTSATRAKKTAFVRCVHSNNSGNNAVLVLLLPQRMATHSERLAIILVASCGSQGFNVLTDAATCEAHITNAGQTSELAKLHKHLQGRAGHKHWQPCCLTLKCPWPGVPKTYSVPTCRAQPGASPQNPTQRFFSVS